MFCTRCGAELGEDAVFCSECGKKIEVVAKAVTEVEAASKTLLADKPS